MNGHQAVQLEQQLAEINLQGDTTKTKAYYLEYLAYRAIMLENDKINSHHLHRVVHLVDEHGFSTPRLL